MPIYEYKAFAPGGATQSGVIDADTERDARQKLRKDKLLVHKLAEVRGSKRSRKKGADKAAGGGCAGPEQPRCTIQARSRACQEGWLAAHQNESSSPMKTSGSAARKPIPCT